MVKIYKEMCILGLQKNFYFIGLHFKCIAK